MDCISVQSTWTLLLFKTLSSVFNLFFYIVFSSSDGQLTRSLSTKNAGSLQLLMIDLFCFMDYIHEQLTQLLQCTSFKIFLVLMFFFLFFVVAYTYHCRSIKKQPPSNQYYRYFLNLIFFVSFLISLSYRTSGPFKQGHRNVPSNIALESRWPGVPTQQGNESNLITTASSSDLTFSQMIVWV